MPGITFKPGGTVGDVNRNAVDPYAVQKVQKPSGFDSPEQQTAWSAVAPSTPFANAQAKTDLWNQTFHAPSAPNAVNPARDQATQTAWHPFQSFDQFWNANGGTTADSFTSAINTWNASHPNDLVTPTGHSGDAVMYRGRVYDGIFNVGSSDARNQWIEPGGDNGGGGGAAPGGSTYGNSASTDLYVNQILSRLMELHKPIEDPFRNVANKTALEQAGQLLTGTPYTSGQDAALRAHYLEPITQARDAALERNAELSSARGFGSAHGGVAGLGDKRIEGSYAQAVSQGANDLAVRAIDEGRSRHTQGLNILNQLLESDRQRRSEENAQSAELLKDSALLPGLDESRVRLLLDATSDQGSTINAQLSQLIQLANQNRYAGQSQDAQNQQDDQAIGSAIARILSTWGNS